MKAIKEVLGITQYEYEYYIFDYYTIWCGHNATNNHELQTLLSSQVVFKWFSTLYEALELEFYDKISKTTKQSNQHLYKQIMLSTVGYHPPKSLLQKIKKAGIPNALNIISNHN